MMDRASGKAMSFQNRSVRFAFLAVAACATNMKREEESLLFRFTLKHSVLLASAIGLIVMFYAYVMPAWAP